MRFLSASETMKANDVPSTMYSTENTSSLRESLETTASVLQIKVFLVLMNESNPGKFMKAANL